MWVQYVYELRGGQADDGEGRGKWLHYVYKLCVGQANNGKGRGDGAKSRAAGKGGEALRGTLTTTVETIDGSPWPGNVTETTTGGTPQIKASKRARE